MIDTTADPKPLWLSILQFPLVRIVVLGGALFYMMGWTEGRIQAVKDDPALGAAIALGLGLVAMGVYLAYARLVERRGATELSLPGAGRDWAIGALIGAGLYIGCVLILMLLGIYRIEGMNPISFLIPAIAMAVKSGIFEELVFRGVLLKSIEDMLGTWVAVILSSATFGFLHLLNPDATIGGAVYITIEAGLLLAGAYLVTRRLWMAIGFHMAWNYVQSAIFSGIVSGGDATPGLIRDTISGPDLLTGGSFGMERSIVALVLCTTAGVILLLIAMRRGNILPPPWKG